LLPAQRQLFPRLRSPPTFRRPPMYVPPPVEDFGGWYLRGDIGFSNQQVKKLDNALY
jgi:hypothetical protein